jgi:putative transposase
MAMKLAHRYKLKPTTQQKATLRTWIELCRRQYNYRLGERLRWWETTRTPVNACPLTCSIVPVEEIYKDVPEYRVQVRDGRKKDKNGNPVTKKGDKHPNIVGKDEKGKDLVDLPGIGLVPLVLHRPIPTGFKVKTATVRCEADSWYITFSLEDLA